MKISSLEETIEFQERNLIELKEKISDLQKNLEVHGLDNREIKRIAQEKIAKNQNFQEIINDLTEKLVISSIFCDKKHVLYVTRKKKNSNIKQKMKN